MPEQPDMFEASLLPEGDPLRESVAREVASGSPELQAQWRDLLAEAAVLRESLRNVGLPEGLQASLLGVPACAAGAADDGWGGQAVDAGAAEMEIASLLPPEDPVRRAWEARMAAEGGADPAGALRERWQQVVHESGALRAGLVAPAALPAGLEARLLKIPDASRRRRFGPLVRWTAAALAAVLLFLAGVGMWRWHLTSTDRRSLAAVAAAVAPQHPSPPGLVVESGDTRVVAAALEQQGVDMQPIIINWRRGGTELLGGGVVTLNGDRAFFTTWQWRGQRFTLYQFHPRTFGLRENFSAHEEELPAAPGEPPKRLYYWAEPDHHCGWALVTAGPIHENPFIW